jgi:hypothetical protein
MYALFHRIGQFKNYDTTVLYNSVSGSVPIDVWYKHIDILKPNNEGKSTLDEFTRFANEVLNN